MSFISTTRKYRGFRIDTITTTSGPDFTDMVPGFFRKPKVTKRWEVYEFLENGVRDTITKTSTYRNAKLAVDRLVGVRGSEATE